MHTQRERERGKVNSKITNYVMHADMPLVLVMALDNTIAASSAAQKTAQETVVRGTAPCQVQQLTLAPSP